MRRRKIDPNISDAELWARFQAFMEEGRRMDREQQRFLVVDITFIVASLVYVGYLYFGGYLE